MAYIDMACTVMAYDAFSGFVWIRMDAIMQGNYTVPREIEFYLTEVRICKYAKQTLPSTHTLPT